MKIVIVLGKVTKWRDRVCGRIAELLEREHAERLRARCTLAAFFRRVQLVPIDRLVRNAENRIAFNSGKRNTLAVEEISLRRNFARACMRNSIVNQRTTFVDVIMFDSIRESVRFTFDK